MSKKDTPRNSLENRFRIYSHCDQLLRQGKHRELSKFWGSLTEEELRQALMDISLQPGSRPLWLFLTTHETASWFDIGCWVRLHGVIRAGDSGNPKNSHRIVCPPGSRLKLILSWVFSKRTMERAFDNILNDLQHEYNEALFEGRRYKAVWVRLRAYWAVAGAAGLQWVVVVSKKLIMLWHSSR